LNKKYQYRKTFQKYNSIKDPAQRSFQYTVCVIHQTTMNKYTTIIGMEVHVELQTNSKMFCSCKNNPDFAEPNINICEICTGQPGTLPVANKVAIIFAVRIGKALGCTIREFSKFDRKHYFYPDLPKGYQISQYDEPIAEHGKITLTFPLQDNIRDEARITIERVHIEEDTAKLTHSGSSKTFVDFNRSGVPLVEIVTQPDFKTALEAKIYCQELQLIMRALEVSDADMEKGHMRCEANVSVQETGSFEIVDGLVKPLNGVTLNQKVELKNINSFKAIEKAITFEIKRQTEMIEAGKTWVQQTRGWNENTNKTILQRTKENAQDYRYFPEPDIPPFHPRTIAGTVHLPEFPQARRIRFREEYGFSYADAKLLGDDKTWATFTQNVMSELINWLYALQEIKSKTDEIKKQKKIQIAKLAGGWLTNKLTGLLNDTKRTIDTLATSPENIAELIALIYTKKINATNAQKILAEMVVSDKDIDPTHLMEERNYGQIKDENLISKSVDDIIERFPNQVVQFKNGKDPVIKFLVGMVMKVTEGSADPVIVEKLLREKLT